MKKTFLSLSFLFLTGCSNLLPQLMGDSNIGEHRQGQWVLGKLKIIDRLGQPFEGYVTGCFKFPKASGACVPISHSPKCFADCRNSKAHGYIYFKSQKGNVELTNIQTHPSQTFRPLNFLQRSFDLKGLNIPVSGSGDLLYFGDITLQIKTIDKYGELDVYKLVFVKQEINKETVKEFFRLRNEKEPEIFEISPFKKPEGEITIKFRELM